MLYLRDGVWDGRRVLPAGWVDYGRTPSYSSEDGRFGYGAHWWIDGAKPSRFYASGTLGQRLMLVPEADLLIVRLGDLASSRIRDGAIHLDCPTPKTPPAPDLLASMRPPNMEFAERMPMGCSTRSRRRAAQPDYLTDVKI